MEYLPNSVHISVCASANNIIIIIIPLRDINSFYDKGSFYKLYITHSLSLQCTGAPDSSTVTASTTVQILRTALISVTCVLVMMSALTFLIGFICGHCFSQRWRRPSGKEDDESPSNFTTEPRKDLELKENVAYITIRPK